MRCLSAANWGRREWGRRNTSGQYAGMAALQPLLDERNLLEGKLLKASEAPAGAAVQRASRDVQRGALSSAELVLCTLSAAGGQLAALRHHMLGRDGGTRKGHDIVFDAVVVDEAAQAIEPASLIPLYSLEPSKVWLRTVASGFFCAMHTRTAQNMAVDVVHPSLQGRIVLIGDPKQLPPTVLSKAAAKSLSSSLFERLQRADTATALLQLQYRMHPLISAFPACFFYSGSLKDGVEASQKAAAHHADVRF
jgi:hypothetical protein